MNSPYCRLRHRLGIILRVLLWGPLALCGAEPAAATRATTEGALVFTTEGASFAPVLIVDGNPDILWTWSDSTTSTSATPSRTFGAAGTRAHSLRVTPWSAIRRINIGYDGGDGGSGLIESVPDQQVSAVTGLNLVAPTLGQWCSSYNQITALDFTGFANLDTVECFLSRSLTAVNLAGTLKLKRACFEDCDLRSLDLSQSPLLEDLRGAQNRYPTIDFGHTGAQVWHICVRDNPQMSDQTLFADLAPFPNLAELFIWNDNQSGPLRLPASSPSRHVALLADGNHYRSVDLSGALRNAAAAGTVSFRGNQLESIRIAGCVQITDLRLENNRLGEAQLDDLLTTLDALGRRRADTDAQVAMQVDLRGNAMPGPAGRAAAARLAAKGWTIVTTDWTREPPPAPDTGEAQVDFVTRGDAAELRCDIAGTVVATWHWSDGSTTPAVSGADARKSGLGAGDHAGYLTIANGSALTRFGAADGGGRGHLVAISGLNQAPLLAVLYGYNEGALAALSRLDQTRVREYHLWGTALSPAALDQVFADAVATGVTRGRMWCPNPGTDASAATRAALAAREWTISY